MPVMPFFFFSFLLENSFCTARDRLGDATSLQPEIIHSLPKREAAQPPPHRHTQLTCLNVKAVRE